ncbi:hypothetical protein [Mycolicibacterium monacense]|uniref:Scaffolding protein n=1 Tax=Mycolicibacterium monacense TaxID=85693 RepID=A0AAD1MYQ5_MYCMB|nr:hypothetical protein [Mycolicibacterium monacense]MDA4102044.1 hypothetical protein [Mycolicibacterium monacense DSM 44395]ORB20036.1 hypothetical protein BST34_13825 [Mycolicibacterium monacense DSM 44395]QHP86786.1 hypothetical protein EWR22_16310 [Mycolicibacterium monacense DSM 44395]BBZ60142.1 hypothetical protein MMON_14430 [Mycolicibacterium monacense]
MTDTADQFDPPEVDDTEVGDPAAAASSGDSANASPEQTAEPEPDDDQDDNPNRREARYRLQLREVQAERDQLRGTVEALQRAEVERIAGQQLQKPQAIWAADVKLAGLLDEDGRVDPAKVTEAADVASQALGLAPVRRAPRPDRSQGRDRTAPVGDAWEQAFKG